MYFYAPGYAEAVGRKTNCAGAELVRGVLHYHVGHRIYDDSDTVVQGRDVYPLTLRYPGSEALLLGHHGSHRTIGVVLLPDRVFSVRHHV